MPPHQRTRTQEKEKKKKTQKLTPVPRPTPPALLHPWLPDRVSTAAAAAARHPRSLPACRPLSLLPAPSLIARSRPAPAPSPGRSRRRFCTLNTDRRRGRIQALRSAATGWDLGRSMTTPLPMIEKPKHVKASWDPVAHRVFLDCCIEEVNKNNRPVQTLTKIGYKNLVTNFNKRTKRNYDQKQIKNRWETLKKDYTVWKGLLQHASGLGRDPVTNSIDASDDWWAIEIQMYPEAAKFRIAPLQDEQDLHTIFDKNAVTNVTARVPPSSEAQLKRKINIEDVEGSGCEGDDEPLVTPTRVVGKKKKSCPYSPSPSATPKMSTGSASRLDRMMDIMEKKEKEKERIRMMEEEKSRNSVTSPEHGQDSARQEIRRMVARICEDGAKPGSLEYFYATQLFIIKEYRDVFICLEEDATPDQRLDWIRMTWEQHNKQK